MKAIGMKPSNGTNPASEVVSAADDVAFAACDDVVVSVE